MTKQELLLQHLRQNPMIDLLISRLDLHLHHDTRLQMLVQNRVGQWIEEFKHTSPRVVRESITPQIFRTSQEIQQWIKITKFTL